MYFVLTAGKLVTEKTMCEVLDSSGVKDTDWGEIGIRLGVDSQTLGDVFFEGWKKFDPPVTWEKLASGLEKISGSCYKGAVEKCRNNAGKKTGFTGLTFTVIYCVPYNYSGAPSKVGTPHHVSVIWRAFW